ncbi:MAG: TolC family outer membrane protein [Gammaproteobacteria bacterium]
MTKLTRALALALLVPSLASANELTRIYGLAVDNDTTLRAAAGARDAAVAANPRARGALLPLITGAVTAEEGTQQFTVNGVESPEEDTDGQDLRLTLRQALFDAAAWNRWQSAGQTAAAAQATYVIAEQNLAFRVTEAYFNLLAAADSVRFADAEKKAVERQLELAKRRFEVGLSAITDVQEAQARYDLTVAQMIEAEQILSNAQVAVSEITGASDARIVPLQDEIPLLGPDPGDVGQWVKTASDNNLSIRVAQATAEAAEQDVDAAWAAHYPTVYFVGQGALGESNSVTPGIGRVESEYDTTNLQLVLNVPIFAGGSTQAGVNAAQGTRDQRKAELDGRKRETERTTRNAYQGVVAGVSRVKALKQAVVSNTTALEASEVGLEVGARTAVDVLNAQRELFRAQRDYSRSRYDYLLTVLRLKQAAGQLSPKDVNEIDTLLGSADAVAGG